MRWTDTPHGDINAATQRLWSAYGDCASLVAHRINTDPVYLNRIVLVARNEGGFEKMLTSLNPTWRLAQQIMGKNFFGVEEAITYFKIVPSKDQLKMLMKIPFSEEVLRLCKDTHILIAVFPLSIIDINTRVDDSIYDPRRDLVNPIQAFVRNKGEVGWQLVLKTPVRDSIGKEWSGQQTLLDKNEETPKAQVMAYTIIGHHKATGEKLFKDVIVRCADLSSTGWKTQVGFTFLAKGLTFFSEYIEKSGLTAARCRT